MQAFDLFIFHIKNLGNERFKIVLLESVILEVIIVIASSNPRTNMQEYISKLQLGAFKRI